jgi:hypothetical protein
MHVTFVTVEKHQLGELYELVRFLARVFVNHPTSDWATAN